MWPPAEKHITATGLPILLGGYAAKQCPVRVHNDYAALIPTLRWEPTAEVQADLDAGNAFEAEMFEQLSALHADAVTVDPTLFGAEAVSATVAAMESGAPLVLGGWLPNDPAGGRTGKPDILIRVDGGYLPEMAPGQASDSASLRLLDERVQRRNQPHLLD